MSSASGPSERVIRGNYRVTKRNAANALNEAEKALKVKKDHNLAKIDSYLSEAKSDLDMLKDLCNELIEFIDTKDKTDVVIQAEEDNVYAEFDSLFHLYRDLKAQYVTLLKIESDHKSRAERPAAAERKSIGLTSTFAETNTVKLPRVELRKFSGVRKDFHDWEGLFENIVVKDERFDDLQKLYYLKTLLEGDAAKLVENVTYDASSFQPTWEAVKDFYGNKRSLIAQHFAAIMDLPPIKFEDDIRSALCTVTAAMRGLEVHGVNAKAMSPMITFVVVRKFSLTIRREWEKANTDTSNYPEFSTLELFLKNIAFAFEGARNVEKELPTTSSSNSKSAKKPGGTVAAITDNSSDKPTKKSAPPVKSNDIKNSRQKPACGLCHEPHILPLCNQFLALAVAERLNTVKRLKLCENCLKPNHNIADCRYSNCRKCNQRHNSTLHPDEGTTEPVKSEVVSTTQPSIVLPSAIVYVIQGWRKIPARILLDGCAQMTVVSEEFINKHRIPTIRTQAQIGGAIPGHYTSRFAANLKLRAVHSDFQLQVQAKLSPALQYRVDLRALEIITRNHPELQLDESVSVGHQSIDIILGSDTLHRCVFSEKKVIDSLVFERSQFGWVASGAVNLQSTPTVFNHCVLDVQDALQKYFEVEEVDGPALKLSEADEIENHFIETVRYLRSCPKTIRSGRDRKPFHRNCAIPTKSQVIRCSTI